MIVSLRGILIEKASDGATVEAAGVGHFVSLAPSTLLRLPPVGEEVFLHVVESVAMYGGGTTLYGFLNAEERRFFNVIREHVPGAGAKKALEILERADKSLPDFRRAVLEKDTKMLVGLFGFTSKTASKIVAALEGKLEAVSAGRAKPLGPAAAAMDEAIQGLLALGYREAAARSAAQEAHRSLGPSVSSQQMIREALRHLSGRN